MQNLRDAEKYIKNFIKLKHSKETIYNLLREEELFSVIGDVILKGYVNRIYDKYTKSSS